MAHPRELKPKTYLRDRQTNKLAVIVEIITNSFSKSIYRVKYVDNNKYITLGYLKVDRRFTIDRTATILYGR